MMFHFDFDSLDFQDKIKTMDDRELELLSYDIRDFLLSNVSKTGGHLASNLGVVELTIALHKAFNVCDDRLIWDVGHQSYVHKILTGRSSDFATLRSYGGISGFPKITEHVSDAYNSGHSSSSISAAMGIAEARDLNCEDFNVIAVIGDGALTGGLAFEGINNAGNRKSKLVVILNDNQMSISRNTGSLAQHLRTLRVSQRYVHTKRAVKESLTKIPGIGRNIADSAERFRDKMRDTMLRATMFDELGFKYVGPIDGHNIKEMVELFETVKDYEGPVLIHVITKKGKGYKNSEQNPGKFHGIGPFDPETGTELANSPQSYSKIAGQTLVNMARNDKRIVGISAAMTMAVGLGEFADKFTERFYDVGIAEAHAVTFSAGLALGDMRPFVFIYSTFLQRAYDQIMIDVCAQNLPVVFMIDRAGNVGADGETHHGVFDLSYLRPMPNIIIMAPKNAPELIRMMKSAVLYNAPVAIRYPKGAAVNAAAELLEDANKNFTPIQIGKSERILEGTDVEIRAVGKMITRALETAELLKEKGISCGVVSDRFVKPLDVASILSSAEKGIPIVTIEDNEVMGGFGEAVAGFLTNNGIYTPIITIGWPDVFVPHGDTEKLFELCGIEATSIAAKIEAVLDNSKREKTN